ncbi:hypothetical protein DSO57_1000734 [Entomophthora muscae]|uniref:Uncharacterized protein n=1 Tax=Entomophthora muscae TaxID=34485 RepID=A0ACC2T999_9FUNG|nr:hypothetical protein DSO57_1000734 [Entomophthora muscae]
MSLSESVYLKDTLESLFELADSSIYNDVQLRLRKNTNFKRKPVELPTGYKTRAFLPSSADNASGSFSINVKYLNSNMVTAISKVTLQSTILEVKGQISKVLSILPEHQRLVLKGRALPDNKTLQELNIDSGVVIHLLKKTPPSAPAENESSPVARAALITPLAKKKLSPSAQKLVAQDAFWDGVQSHLTEAYKADVTEEDIEALISEWRDVSILY